MRLNYTIEELHRAESGDTAKLCLVRAQAQPGTTRELLLDLPVDHGFAAGDTVAVSIVKVEPGNDQA
jgi:hypothetical protein